MSQLEAMEAERARIVAALARRAAPPEPMAPKVRLISNLDDQSWATSLTLPRTAKTLCSAAQIAGWEVRTGWSLVAIPEGYRESNHHKAATYAYLLHVYGVWLAAYRTRASAMWHVAGEGAPKSASGAQGAQLSVPGRTLSLGVETLIKYIRGEVGIDEIVIA